MIRRPVPARSRRGGSATGELPAVLLTRDRGLVDHVRALAEAAGTGLEVLPTASAVPGARLVMVGLDLAAELPSTWRGGVLVVRVEGADPPDGVWRQAVQLGAEHVVLLPEGEAWLVDRLVDAGSPDERAPVVAVLGGCGGAGASCLAIGLAVTAASHGTAPVLIDADPLGGGLDLPLGAESVPGLRWPDLPWAAGRLPAGLITSALPQVAGVRLLSCTRGQPTSLSGQAVGAVVDAAAREGDLVVVDLPRHIGDLEAAVLARCRMALLVVPGSVRAAAAGSLVAAMAESHAADLRVVVREPMAAGCLPETVADAMQIPLQGRLEAEPGLDGALDAGEAAALRTRGPLAAIARDVLAELLAPA